MKYVFQVHSSLTAAGSMRYLTQKKWALEACIFLCWRGAESYLPSDATIVPYTHAIENKDFKYALDFQFKDKVELKKRQQNIQDFRNWLAGFLRTEFYFITPHLAYIRDRLIVDLPQCKGYYFLEEGMGAYTINERIGWSETGWFERFKNRLKSKKLFGFDVQIEKGVYFEYRKYKGALGYSEQSFQGLSSLENIGLPFRTDLKQKQLNHLLVLDNYAIGVFDQVSNYFDELEFLLKNLVEGGVKELHYKSHPTVENSEGFASYLEDFLVTAQKLGMTLTPLLSSESLEDLALSNKDQITIYGAYSAGLFYTCKGGVNTFFMTQRLIQKDQKFAQYIHDNFPEEFIQLTKNYAFESSFLN